MCTSNTRPLHTQVCVTRFVILWSVRCNIMVCNIMVCNITVCNITVCVIALRRFLSRFGSRGFAGVRFPHPQIHQNLIQFLHPQISLIFSVSTQPVLGDTHGS